MRTLQKCRSLIDPCLREPRGGLLLAPIYSPGLAASRARCPMAMERGLGTRVGIGTSGRVAKHFMHQSKLMIEGPEVQYNEFRWFMKEGTFTLHKGCHLPVGPLTLRKTAMMRMYTASIYVG